MQHYGIDPRKFDNVLSVQNTSYGSRGHYNPYSKNSSSIHQQRVKLPKHNSLHSTSNQNFRIRHSNNGYSSLQANPTRSERMNRTFDLFIQSIQTEPIYIALEKVARDVFAAQSAVCWNVIVNYSNFAHQTVNSDSKTVNIKDYEENTTLYSQRLSKSIQLTSSQSILASFSKSHLDKSSLENGFVQKYSNPSNDSDFDGEVDSPSPTILLPIYDEDDILCFVIQICFQLISSNNIDKELFSFDDEKIGNLLSKKLSMYSHFFCISDGFSKKKLHSTINGIQSISNRSEQILISEIYHKLKNLFKCRLIEFWVDDVFDTCILKYNENAGKFVPVSKDCGAVREIFESSNPIINLANVKKSSYYSAENDGFNDESIIMYLMNIDNNHYSIVLRGKQNNEKFSMIDERMLTYLVPLIINLFNDCHKRQNSKKDNNNNDNISSNKESSRSESHTLTSSRLLDSQNSEFAERLKALLEVAEIISGVLDIDILIPTIMERACSLLNTERCSLFLVDPVKQELITRFHGGLNKSIRIPLKKGIVGHTATTGNIVNIKDAYSDSRFDNHVDLATGFRTKTILTVPIYNNRGEIAGVTEMINKFDDGVFDEDDIKMLMAFNVFCGISLDNAKLYNSSLDLTRQLRTFVEMSNAMNQEKQIHNVLEQILGAAQDVINATRATIFMKDGDELLPFVSIGEEVKHGSLFADELMSSSSPQPHIFPREEIFLRVQSQSDKPLDGFAPTPLGASIDSGGNSNKASTTSKGLARISAVLVRDDDGDDSILSNQSSVFGNGNVFNENICGIPLISSSSKVLGVLELCSAGKIMPEDLKLLDCFAVFATVSIERSELQEIAQLGQTEVQIKQYLSSEERKGYDLPAKMKLDIDNDTLFTNNFDAVAYDGIGHFKVLFTIANEYGILKEFNISNEKWFRFMIEISQTYKKVPYHNWRHAVDVCQFTSYEIKRAKLLNVFTKFELFGFLVAAICHDANHDGFTNTFNEKAQTPLGILYKNQSVMETHHCTVAITVISKEECNLFSGLNSDQFKSMWTQIFQLILVTDMAKHFDFLKSINADLDRDGPYDLTVPENRMKVMQLILKCGDISNVARPFELADKWCDVLCEEFFRQGDLEKANGMEYTSANNDREHLDKPKSQIGFYTFVCLPLYQLGARVFPELQANVDQVQSNLAIWKAASEKNENK